MTPKIRQKIVRGRTRNKTKERKGENEEEQTQRHEVESNDLLEHLVQNGDDGSLSLSSESSSSIVETKPWQKKNSTASPWTEETPPPNRNHLLAMIPSSLLNPDKKKKQSKSKSKSSRYQDDDDNDNDDSVVNVKVVVKSPMKEPPSQDSASSSIEIPKKKKKVLEEINNTVKLDDMDITIQKKKRKDLDVDEKNEKDTNEKPIDAIPKKTKRSNDSKISLLSETDKSDNKASSSSSNVNKNTKISSNVSGRDNSGTGGDTTRGSDHGRKSSSKKESRRDRDKKNNVSRHPKELGVFNSRANEISDSNRKEKNLEEIDRVIKLIFNDDKKGHDSDDESDQRYDFFDRDKDEKIVKQKWIPMFPEDFSSSKDQWPLSWWGIVEPPKHLMYPETVDNFRQAGGHLGNPHQNPQHLHNGNHPNPSMPGGHYPHSDGYQQRGFNYPYNPPNNVSANGRPRGPEGWGNMNPKDAPNHDGRDMWQDRPPFRGPPGRGGMEPRGKEYGPNSHSYQDEKRR